MRMKQKIVLILLFLFILIPSEVVAQDYSKMSRTLRKKVHQMEAENRSRGAARSSSDAAKGKEILALIKVDGDLVEDYCVSHHGNIHIVLMPLSKIADRIMGQAVCSMMTCAV